MKALTLHQPWASLVALGVKTIETRSWATRYRGPLAIHAGKAEAFPHSWNIGEWRAYRADRADRPNARPTRMYHRDEGWATRPETPVVLPLGCVVATCTLVDVLPIVLSPTLSAGEAVPNLALIDPGPERGLRWTEPLTDCAIGWRIHPCEDQRSYGDFTSGRFAWLLAEITSIEPVPAKGKQGLWEWAP